MSQAYALANKTLQSGRLGYQTSRYNESRDILTAQNVLSSSAFTPSNRLMWEEYFYTLPRFNAKHSLPFTFLTNNQSQINNN